MPKNSALLTRSFRKEFPVAVRGKDAWIEAERGKRYLDFSGSAAVNFIGHGVPEIAKAMAEQAKRLEFVHSSQFITRQAEEFAEEILDFAGKNFRGGKVYFTSGGSEAVEAALKLARQYQLETGEARRYEVLSRRQSYHGATLGALAASGNLRRREMYLPMVREFEHIGIPYCYRCPHDCKDCARKFGDELDSALRKNERAAAFIFEPVSGATLGAALPPDGYVQHVAEVCRKHGVLLIADEVMTGFGRTGRTFAVEHWQSAPDIIVCGKGISSGYAPLGAMIANQKIVEAIAKGSGAFVHGFTYNAHPVAIAAGSAVMKVLRKQKLAAAANSESGKIGRAMREELLKLLSVDCVGDVRGRGLLWGVEFVRDKRSKEPFPAEHNFAGKVAQAAFVRGILVYPIQGCVDGYRGDHLLLAPPAIITPKEIEFAVAELRSAIEETVIS
jgi:adenosylmethionine-8-amino-7-oxononanoate aminotransferase